MAVDGRKLGKSLYQGSDDDHDFPCSPCTKEGKNVAAVKHCVECDENLCKKCLSDHNKFAVMRGHQLLDKVKSPSGKTLELPSQRCERHGKLIDVYCPGHDKVGCSTCMTIEHSGCAGICFIPEIASKTKPSEKLQLLETEISKLRSRFLALKQKKQGHLETLRKEKRQLLNEIKSERKRINEHLDKMEAELLQEVDTSFQTKLHHIESEMKEVDAKIDLLQDNLQKINTAKHDNASERFVQVKCISEKKALANASLENGEKTTISGRVHFEPFQKATESNCNAIGKIINLQTVKVDGCSGLNVGTDNDEKMCNITNMCLCTDGSLAIVDTTNKRTKKVNELFEVTSSLKVGDKPFGICLVDSSLLAITLMTDRKVQFISQNEPMKLQQSFNVGDRCRGIAYSRGLIYVCCGGSKTLNEGVGHIEVYTVSGALLTSLYGDIDCPTHITVHASSFEIYISDLDRGIMLLDTHRDSKFISLNHTIVGCTDGLCWINENLFCVSSYKSNRILLMSTNGEVQQELLHEKDGVCQPLVVYFNKKTSKLFVSQNINDTIMVFTLKITC